MRVHALDLLRMCAVAVAGCWLAAMAGGPNRLVGAGTPVGEFYARQGQGSF